jgi:hypothetical protein
MKIGEKSPFFLYYNNYSFIKSIHTIMINLTAEQKQLVKQTTKILRNECNSGDTEIDHASADKAIYDLIKGLGFKSIAKLYNAVDKWYA